MDGFSEFQGQGVDGARGTEFQRHGGIEDMEFPQGTDKSV